MEKKAKLDPQNLFTETEEEEDTEDEMLNDARPYH